MKRVLVVEGDPTLRDLYETALREDGHEVILACDYADALAQNLLKRPDIVILDPGVASEGLRIALELARVNRRAAIVFNTMSPFQLGRDFQAWVADAITIKGEGAGAIRRTVRALAEAAAGGDPE